MNGMNADTISRQRDAFLRFYATMTHASYKDVRDEYLGKSLKGGVYVNRLYPAVETAINWMNEPPSKDTSTANLKEKT